jgi:riboflavin biosynthesis pyrimidine reductase
VILTRVFPGTPEVIELDAATSRDRLLELYRPPSLPWLRLNLITSVSGSSGGSDGTSETLTNPADRRLLGVIRELADVVIIGAESLRREGYVVPARSRLAVVTASGDLTGHAITADVEPGRLLVVCPLAAVDRVRESLGRSAVEIVVVPDADGRLTMADVLVAVRARGCESVVCEGGPHVAAQFVAEGLVNEVCLSTSPTIGGTALPLLAGGDVATRRLSLHQLLVDDRSGLYARWSVDRAEPATT